MFLKVFVMINNFFNIKKLITINFLIHFSNT